MLKSFANVVDVPAICYAVHMENTKGNKGLMIAAVVIGSLCIVVGLIYAFKNAGSLPTFFPGYSQGSTDVHTKHAIAAFVVGIALFIFAWFQGGPRKSTTGMPPTAQPQ